MITQKIIALVLASSLLSGCATVVRGTHQEVSVTSKPSRTIVLVNGQGGFKTPATLELPRRRDHILTFEKEGYESVNVIVLHIVNSAVAGNILLGGVIGLGVDAITGAQYKLAPEAVNVELKKDSVWKAKKPVIFKENVVIVPEKRLEVLKNLFDDGHMTPSAPDCRNACPGRRGPRRSPSASVRSKSSGNASTSRAESNRPTMSPPEGRSSAPTISTWEC